MFRSTCRCLMRRSTVRRKTTEAVKLKAHPGVTQTLKTAKHFLHGTVSLPTTLEQNHVELSTLYLSVDPYMRCRFDPNHPQLGEYLEPFRVGEPLSGGGVGDVIASRHPNFVPGDKVCVPFLGFPWQRTVQIDASNTQIEKIALDDASAPLSLGALGMPGLTSYFGMLKCGRPAKGETVVISGAAGACGTIAGQLAKVRCGARVVGICGSDEKCDYLKTHLNFDAAINYRDPGLREALRDACPGGVDVYFDNVGGQTSDLVLELVNTGARIPVCGQIASYRSNVPYTKLVSPEGISRRLRELLEKRQARRFRFLVLDHEADFGHALRNLTQWVAEGSLLPVQTITTGFRPAEAFIGMMAGENIGKAIVDVRQDGPRRTYVTPSIAPEL